MATSRELLQAFFNNVMRLDTAHTIPANQNFLDSLATRVDLGIDTLAFDYTRVAALAISTTSVANLSYNFFTGLTPTSGGLDYLVSPIGDNPNNLNSAYYQSFNLENRYINFAVNLGKLGEGAARFNAMYGSLTLEQSVVKAYKEIFGIDKAGIEGILTVDVGGQTRAQYFASYGKDGLTGLGTKAAMVGWLLGEAAKAPGTGTYNRAEANFLMDLGPDGVAAFHTNIVPTYAAPPVVTLKNTSDASGYRDDPNTAAAEDGVDYHLQNYSGAPTTAVAVVHAYYAPNGGSIGTVPWEAVNGANRGATVRVFVDSDSTAGLIYGYTLSGLSPSYKGPVPNLKIIGPGALKAQIAANFSNVDASQAGDLDLAYHAYHYPTAAGPLIGFWGAGGTFTLGNGTNKLNIIGEYRSEKYVLGTGTDTITIGGTGFIAGDGSTPNPFVQSALNNVTFTGQTLNNPFELNNFSKGVDHLVLDPVVHAMPTNVQPYVAGATSLLQALVQVSGQLTAGQGAVFTYQGDTYVYAQDATPGLNTGDGLIKLVGVTGLTVGTGAANVDIHYG